LPGAPWRTKTCPPAEARIRQKASPDPRPFDPRPFEVARIRLPASTLPQLATLFMTTVDELVGHAQQRHAGKRGPLPKWQQQIEAIAQLPKTQQRFVTQMLDTVLAQARQ
jgi:hypothetical protein